MENRTTFAYRAELLVLGLLPLLFGVFVIPARTPTAELNYPRLALLCVAALFLIVLRALQTPNMQRSDLLPKLAKQPNYILAALAFALSIVISASLSPNSAQSWLGSIEYPVGAIFALLCMVIFWLYASGPTPSRKGAAALIIFISVVTVAEFLGFRPLAPIIERTFHFTNGFPIATVGYRGHLAGILIILALLPLYWFHRRKKDWRFWCLVIIAAVALGCTTNSAAIIALAVAVLIYLVLELTSGTRGLYLFLLPMVITLSMGCVYPLSYINKQLAAFGAVHNASDSKDLANTRSLEIRFLLWEAAANMFKSRPIIGWGTQSYSMHWFDFLSKEKADKTLALEMGYPRNQKIVRVRDVIYFKDSKGGIVARTQSYDSPHNATLDVLYAQGFLGIATLIWFLIACILAAYRYAGIKGLIGLLPFVGYAIYLQAWFATVPVMGLAIILLGFVLAELRRSHLAPIPQHALRQVPNGHAVTPISTPTGSIHITPSEK